MAWGTTALAHGTSTDKTSNTSLVHTIANNSAVAGDFLIVAIAKDNTSTTDGDNSEVSSVEDSQGNSYSKLHENTNAGSAGTTACCSVWGSVLGTGLTISTDTITATYASSTTADIILAVSFTIGAGNVVTVEGTNQASEDNTTPASLAISGLTSREYLWWRSTATEVPSTTNWTPTSGWTAGAGVPATSGNPSHSNQSLRVEYDVLTATSNTSAPSISGNADHSSVMVALKEDAPPSATGTGWFLSSHGGWWRELLNHQGILVPVY